MRTYQEASDAYVVEKLGDAYGKKENLPSICVGLEDQPGIETVIPDIRDDYKNQVIVQENVLYYKYVGDKQRVQWCFEAGIPVWGYGTYDEFILDIEYAPITKGEYEEVGGVYVCSPDLTGFNPKTTYYVLYNQSFTETIGNTLKVGAPENITDWYNYAETSKKWANIMTIEEDGNTTNLENDRAYFVWIPRYIYKLDSQKQEAEIRFVDKNNVYKYIENEEIKEIQYTLSSLETGIMQVDGIDTEYKMPESFWWDNNGNGVIDNGESLSGFWVSKYEISSNFASDIIIDDLEFSITDTTISIINMKVTQKNPVTVAKYEVFLNDELKGSPTTISSSNYFNFTDLSPNTEYTIKICAKDSNGNILGKYTYPYKVKTLEKSIAELTKPNLQGFEKTHTYYVIYDSSGNETIGSKVDYDENGVPTNIPGATESNPNGTWYNYENKIWANIVTIGGDGNPENSENDRAYFTWIPRYEYKLKDKWQDIEIRFISTSQTEANTALGYKLPESFTWDNDNDGTVDSGESLAGYWVSKYEVSAGYGKDVTINDTEFSMTDTTISIINMDKTNTGSIQIASYEVFANGESKGSQNDISSSKPFKIEGLSANTEYTIKIHVKDSNGNILGIYTAPQKVKTTEKSIAELTKPNLKGFDKNHTYYVTYDSSGNETIGSKVDYDTNGVPTNIPTGWYNYENKIWANIVTIGGDGDLSNVENDRAYFTWIPRYEYKLKDKWQDIEIRFISTSQTEANTALGYKLPESFTWDNDNDGIVDSGESLAGYWVSKYEVSDIN